MSPGSQPDPVSRPEPLDSQNVDPGKYRFDPAFEASCDALFSGAVLPRVQPDPVYGLQKKVNALVEEYRVVATPGQSHILKGEKTEVLFQGPPVEMVFRGAKEVIVPFVAVTGLNKNHSASQAVETPELRLGLYFSTSDLTSMYPLNNLDATKPPGAGAKASDDLIGALQWLKLIDKLGAMSAGILAESQSLIFSSDLRSLMKLRHQIGEEGIEDAKKCALGKVDAILLTALTLGVEVHPSHLAHAIQAEPALIESTPFVKEFVDLASSNARKLPAKVYEISSMLEARNWRAFRYYWNFVSACLKYTDVRKDIHEFLRLADIFHEKKPDGINTVAGKLTRDLRQLRDDVQEKLKKRVNSSRSALSEFESTALDIVLKKLDIAVLRAWNSTQGYSGKTAQVRKTFIKAVKDLHELHTALCSVEDTLSKMKTYSNIEESPVLPSSSIAECHTKALQILKGLNRDCSYYCPGLFVR